MWCVGLCCVVLCVQGSAVPSGLTGTGGVAQLRENSAELGRRVATELQLDELQAGVAGSALVDESHPLGEAYYSGLSTCNLAFDETGHFLVSRLFELL